MARAGQRAALDEFRLRRGGGRIRALFRRLGEGDDHGGRAAVEALQGDLGAVGEPDGVLVGTGFEAGHHRLFDGSQAAALADAISDAFEVKDFAQIQNACELFGQKSIPIIWGPLRHGPGHNVSTYHHNPDQHVVEFYIELDQMKDETLGYFEPRPWHHDLPQRPKVWRGKNSRSVWGPPPTEEYERSSRRQ